MHLGDLTCEKWVFIIDHSVKQKQGIWLYYCGVPYPRRVYFSKLNDPNYFLRALNALGIAKKTLMALLRAKDVVIPRTLNFKKYEGFLRNINELCNWILGEYYIKDDEWSESVWEIGKLVKNFLKELGFIEEACIGFSKIIMCFLEFDCAYRYRVQDLLGEITHLDRSTLKYILNIYVERETMGVKEKILKAGKLLGLILWLPKFSKALERAQVGIDFNKFKLDINDRYHTSFWRGYDYGGKNFDERYQFFLDTHKGNFPPYQKRERPEVLTNFLIGE
jgi:hypothetical protein